MGHDLIADVETTPIPEEGRPTFAQRFASHRADLGPLVLGLDPSASVLGGWGLPDDVEGLDRFADIVLEAAVGTVGVVKAQSGFFERHGWRGIRTLSRLVASARQARLLVILDAKRGDVGSTNEAYASGYLGPGAPLGVDALTVSPYLGVGALGAFFDGAAGSGSALFVVTRSSNPEGRALQRAVQADGRTVEESILAALGERNSQVAPAGIGPFGAVVGPIHGPAPAGLVGMGGLVLAPGLGAQGAEPSDVAACFASCPERVLPSASRALLAAGPSVVRLRDACRTLNDALIRALGP
ncbi:MAG: orotidine-5'-phosphate decarboxylase [Acidimicrobiales bacterium]